MSECTAKDAYSGSCPFGGTPSCKHIHILSDLMLSQVGKVIIWSLNIYILFVRNKLLLVMQQDLDPWWFSDCPRDIV